MHRDQRPAVPVLRTSRFFPEADDDADVRGAYDDANLKANELLYRRVDIEDVVSAHLLALERAPALGFGRYIVSATTPFVPRGPGRAAHRRARGGAPALPGVRGDLRGRGWRMFGGIERVYVRRARARDLGWSPRHDFRRRSTAWRRGEEPRSDLARAIGAKGYHAAPFEEGPYPVA